MRHLVPLKLQLAAVGKWKRGPEQTLFDHYISRLQWDLRLDETAAFTKLSPPEQKKKETAGLADAVKKFGAEKLIVLDPTGKDLGSEGLADWLGKAGEAGARKISFVIGGDAGLDSNLLPTSLKLSFGKAIWPHLLVRGMLAEQLFRAQCILTDHPYHRA